MWPASLPKIGFFHEAHAFLKDNEYILSGYRIYFNSTRHILRSLFMLHNESANVWSHLIGVMLFCVLLGYTALSLDIQPGQIACEISSAISTLP
jgi:predicted membrane channel-forming protein YqfA (hemolysin III family)